MEFCQTVSVRKYCYWIVDKPEHRFYFLSYTIRCHIFFSFTLLLSLSPKVIGSSDLKEK